MKTATVTEAKNGLSALLDQVKAGESFLITDRGRPIAVVEPFTAPVDPMGHLVRLAREGLATLGSEELSDDFLAGPRFAQSEGRTLSAAIMEERSTGL